ncbi:NUDIX domain-containing protein [Pontibacter harenae]|uniref:NUDIX domain-containing protein n=1 Tax=Pontibacter harenae TaxID=2894083 RepID=UPI001E57076B|nr:NUDIX hydrolase [Pontibacter harenae]MCC9166798.1 NUDIX hydrolase [Pontibacter harenae]
MEIKSRKLAYDGYFKIDELTIEHEGATFTREQFKRGDAVAALVYDTEQQLYVLTRQYRTGPEHELVEVVAGMVDEGESPEESIKREVEEEIGYHVEKMEHLHTFYSSPGGCTERVFLYYAEVSKQHASGGGNEHENEHIEILRYTTQELAELVTQDAKTIIAQQWVRLKK